MKDILRKFLLALAVTALIPAVGQAQMRIPRNAPHDLTTQKQSMENDLRFHEKYPMVISPNRRASSGLFQTPSTLKAPRPQRVATTPDGTEIWGALFYADNWSATSDEYGLYTFNALSNITLDPIYKYSYFVPNGGGVLKDGKYYCMSYTQYDDEIYPELYIFNTDPWKYSTYKTPSSIDLLATDVSLDPTDNKVYGCFYSSTNTSGFQFGTIDYDDLSMTKIADLSQAMLGIAINSAGEIYGLAVDGNLYKIDKTSGATTLVGATGLTLKTSEGNYSYQGFDFDQRKGTLYWAAVPGEGNSALYTVDTTTGAATKIADFPHNEQIIALQVPKPSVEDGAPAIITDLTISFNAGATTGNVNFTVPSKSFDGNDLTGELTYYIVANDDTISTGTATPGEKKSVEVSVPSGQTEFAVTTTNSVGSSAKAKASQYIGFDVPEAVGNVKLSVEGQTATVSWTKSDSTLNGGYMGAITYDVMRLPDSVAVATGITDTTITDEIPAGPLKPYSYRVTAHNGDASSEPAYSNTVAVGDAIEPPYYEYFETQANFDMWTVIDANGDSGDGTSNTWHWYTRRYGEPLNVAEYSTDWYTRNAANDWLISPEIHLLPGNMYQLSFSSKGGYFDTNKLSLAYGEGTDTTGYTNVLMPETELTNYENFETRSFNVSVEKEGKYHFAFHLTSAAGNTIQIDSFFVKAPVSLNAPDSVTALTVTPGENGTLSAVIAFTAPTKNLSGDDLQSLSCIKVFRGTELVDSISATPGQSLSVTDNAPANGVNEYSVIAYNDYGQSITNTASAFVGIDTPLEPENVTLSDNGTGLTLTWEAPGNAGTNGGFVDVPALKYNVWSYTSTGYRMVTNLLKGDIDGFETTIEASLDSGTQRQTYYGVSAKNDIGESDIVRSSTVLVGKPYTLPFKESWPRYTNDNLGWETGSTRGNAFRMSTDSYDGDRGMMQLSTYYKDVTAWLKSGKISLEGSENPTLFYHYYVTAGKNIDLKVAVQKADGTADTLQTVNVADIEGSEAGWHEGRVELNGYDSERYIRVAFIVDNHEESATVGIDDVEIYSIYADNLVASLTGVQNPVNGGEKGEARVNVHNEGKSTATNYTVWLYADGEKVDSVSGAPLATLADSVYTLHFPTKVNADSISVYAYVDFPADKVPENNTTNTVSVKVNRPTWNAIDDLTGTAEGQTVTLDWTAPKGTIAHQTTEDFESYTPNVISDYIGEWRTIDGDGARTFSVGEPDDEYLPKAFKVFNPYVYEWNLSLNYWLVAHSGQQYAACFDAENVQSNDWLISPKLSGEAQEISFYAGQINTQYGTAKYQIMYSTTDADTASFKLLQTDTISNRCNSGDWGAVRTAQLPQGAKFFALHNVSDKVGITLFDDITYMAAVDSAKIVGFNIYRDGELIGTVDSLTTTYTDATGSEGNHTYNVTVVYNTGESAFSNTVEVGVVTAINGINSDVHPFDVYTIDGMRVRHNVTSLSGLRKGVYIVNGKKVVRP